MFREKRILRHMLQISHVCSWQSNKHFNQIDKNIANPAPIPFSSPLLCFWSSDQCHVISYCETTVAINLIITGTQENCSLTGQNKSEKKYITQLKNCTQWTCCEINIAFNQYLSSIKQYLIHVVKPAQNSKTNMFRNSLKSD